tara:strand:- start:1517 stop:1795 length:279 start_codon:yes stop_codon:yes gene_type:complete
MNKRLSEEQIIDDAVKKAETVAAFHNHVNQIKYKEVLNKEIAEAREYINVDKHVHADVVQLMKTDKQHIIEVLLHAMATIRHLRNGKSRSTK